MKKIVFDTETTGFDVKRDKLVEIGAFELDEKNQPTGQIFHVYINPEQEVPETAVQVHGLTSEFLADKSIFNEIKENFLKFIEDKELIAHNLPFELELLERELNIKLPNKKTDTLTLAKNVFPEQKNTLDALCERFSINITDIPYHGTLLNAYCLALVYSKLMNMSDKE